MHSQIMMHKRVSRFSSRCAVDKPSPARCLTPTGAPPPRSTPTGAPPPRSTPTGAPPPRRTRLAPPLAKCIWGIREAQWRREMQNCICVACWTQSQAPCFCTAPAKLGRNDRFSQFRWSLAACRSIFARRERGSLLAGAGNLTSDARIWWASSVRVDDTEPLSSPMN
jgi:hypothetical protein